MQREEQLKNWTKRRLAKCSFWTMAVTGLAIIISGLASDSCAKRISDMSAFLTAWFGIHGGVVLGYFGVSTWGYRAEVQSPFGGKRSVTGSGVDTRNPPEVK